MRGRKPTPTPILEARGSWRAKTRPNEPRPEKERPICPKWLSTDAKKVWKALIPKLDAAGILTNIDGYALHRYCEHYAEWKRSREFVNQHGIKYPIKDPSGAVIGFKMFPEAILERSHSKALIEIEREFGMTPASRPRLQVISDKPAHGNSKDKTRFIQAVK